jgi:hypothetical protein
VADFDYDDEMFEFACCEDHSNICGVVETGWEACCARCPEWGGQS